MVKHVEILASWISNNLTVLILAVMLLGLTNSYLFGGIQFNLGICATASFLMIYPMFVNIKIEDVLEIKNHQRPVILSIIINFAISPVVAYMLGSLFLSDEPFMKLGLMLISLIPTSGMTATWTERSKGDLKVAISIIAVSLIIVIASLPIILPIVTGNLLEAGPWFIFQRIMLVIIIPLVIGDLTRRAIISKNGQDYYKRKKPLFSGLSSAGLLIVLFLIMSLDANALLIESPLLVIKGMVPLIFYYLIMFGISTLLTRKLDYKDAVAVIYGSSVRYLALALGIAVPLLGSNGKSSMVVFIVALAFFVQVPFASFYNKLVLGFLR